MKQPDAFEAFVHAAPRFLFFTGKRGVGKTTLSCDGNGSGGQWTSRVAAFYFLWTF